jgi:hypothetical protein
MIKRAPTGVRASDARKTTSAVHPNLLVPSLARCRALLKGVGADPGDEPETLERCVLHMQTRPLVSPPVETLTPEPKNTKQPSGACTRSRRIGPSHDRAASLLRPYRLQRTNQTCERLAEFSSRSNNTALVEISQPHIRLGAADRVRCRTPLLGRPIVLVTIALRGCWVS